jgi:hypothetical protein
LAQGGFVSLGDWPRVEDLHICVEIERIADEIGGTRDRTIPGDKGAESPGVQLGAEEGYMELVKDSPTNGANGSNVVGVWRPVEVTGLKG